MPFRPSRLLAFCVLVTSLATPAAAQEAQLTPYVTRAEAAMILLKTRLSVEIPDVQSSGVYPDIPPGSWYERYMTLAARYRIVEPQPGTTWLRPNDVVLRSEYLKMVARTFGLPEKLPYFYRDVVREAWYAAYAGIAERYRLFPGDTDPLRLLPDSLLSHMEVARTLQSLLRQIDVPALPTLEEQEVAALKARYNLAQYERISTQSDQVTLVQSMGPTLVIQPQGAEPPSYLDEAKLPGLRAEVVVLVNRERDTVGLPPLRSNALLEGSAQHYAQDMAEQGFFGHVSPAGQTLRDRTDASGYYRQFYDQDCLCVARFVMGENIARGQRTPQEVVEAWMRSPSHRAAILTPAFTDIGIGIRSGLWVQHFGGSQQSFDLAHDAP